MEDKTSDMFKKLFKVGAIKFGQFKLASGITSPVYCDLRVIIGDPNLLNEISELMFESVKNTEIDLICGVPYTALPIATNVSVKHGIPMIMRRKEAKAYGTGKVLEGIFRAGQQCVVFEDVVTSGGSVWDTVQILQAAGLIVSDVVVLVDREQGGREFLESKRLRLTSITTLNALLTNLCAQNMIDNATLDSCIDFLSATKTTTTTTTTNTTNTAASNDATAAPPRMSVSQRIAAADQLGLHSSARRLLSIIASKQSNVCLSADVTSCAELLRLADKAGPHICAIKTHADILRDFNVEAMMQLREIGERHSFVIIEDRKFADIAHTVQLQLTSSVYRYGEWADCVTVHAISGDAVLQVIASPPPPPQAGEKRELGVIVVAEMSSENALTSPQYKQACADMALRNPAAPLIGFVAQSRVSDSACYLHFTPGVKLPVVASSSSSSSATAGGREGEGDGLGQQYSSPDDVAKRSFCDVMIVGRGIIQAADVEEAAIRYKLAGRAMM